VTEISRFGTGMNRSLVSPGGARVGWVEIDFPDPELSPMTPGSL
jgi:hypothetical protein